MSAAPERKQREEVADSDGAVDESALQVAVWSANNPYFDEKRLESRMLIVGDHRINIRQAWKPDGKGGTEIGYGAVVYPSAAVLAASTSFLYSSSSKNSWSASSGSGASMGKG